MIYPTRLPRFPHVNLLLDLWNKRIQVIVSIPSQSPVPSYLSFFNNLHNWNYLEDLLQCVRKVNLCCQTLMLKHGQPQEISDMFSAFWKCVNSMAVMFNTFCKTSSLKMPQCDYFYRGIILENVVFLFHTCCRIYLLFEWILITKTFLE